MKSVLEAQRRNPSLNQGVKFLGEGQVDQLEMLRNELG